MESIPWVRCASGNVYCFGPIVVVVIVVVVIVVVVVFQVEKCYLKRLFSRSGIFTRDRRQHKVAKVTSKK